MLEARIDHNVRIILGFDGSGLDIGNNAPLLIASGGVYTESSPIRDRDIATQYLRLVMKKSRPQRSDETVWSCCVATSVESIDGLLDFITFRKAIVGVIQQIPGRLFLFVTRPAILRVMVGMH